MRKVKFKNVKELYDGSGEVFKPKITPILKGGYRIQGPADAADHIIELNMESTVTEKVSASKQRPSDKFHMKEESGICDVCTSSCSSGMLSERPASLVGVKADDRFSDDASKGKVDIRCLCGDADMLSPMSSACNGRDLSTSEISNHLSACSSHDSFSENEESKDIVRESDISEDSVIPEKVVACQTVVENRGFFTTRLFHNKNNILNQHRRQKALECFGDNISCISCSRCTEKMAVDHKGDTDRKNGTCSSASVDGLPVIENTNNDQPAFCCLTRDFDTVENNQHRSPIKLTKESLQANVVASNKSDLTEISSLRDSYTRASSLKREPSECSEEQVESSLTRAAAAIFPIDSQTHNVKNYAESVKPEIERSDQEVAAEATKCSDQKEHLGKLLGADGSITSQLPSQSQPVNHAEESDLVVDEVKVCDICGDVGREDLLATCSNCIDGAEHTYCMRVKLDKVPEGNWMCEDCLLGEENEKQKQDKFEKDEAVGLKGSLNVARQNSRNSNSVNCKNNLELDVKIGVDKSRKIESSICQVAAKRPEDNSEAFSTKKRRAFEKKDDSFIQPKPCSKAVMCRGSSFESLDKRKMKSTCEGSLSKSKSFNGMTSEVTFPESVGAIKTQNLGRETATSCNERVLCESTSFMNGSSNHVDAADTKVKKLSSDFSHIEDLKRLRHGKERNLIIEKKTFYIPLMRSPMADNCASASMRDKKIPPHGETNLPVLSRPKRHDSMGFQGCGKSSNLLKSTSELAHRGLTEEEQNGFVNDARQNIEHSTDEASAIKSNNLIATHSSVEPSYPKGLPWFSSAADSPWISAVPQLDYIWQGGFQVQRSGTLLSSWNGIQAHLSTCASPKVHEVVHKLPQKILVEQVPRLFMWPSQFLDNQAKEDNIALYFFAKDFESYERNYKILLEHMVKNDLGLQGNIDGIELLIFSSNLLPEKSQRWNNLLFFWGVLRGRRINCLQDIPSPQRKICNSGLYMTPSGSQKACSSAPSSGILSTSNNLCSTQQTSNSIPVEVPTLAAGRIAEIHENKVSSPQQQCSGLQSSDGQLGAVNSPMKNQQLSGEVQLGDSSQGEEKGRKRAREIDLNKECDTDDITVDEEHECKRLKSYSGKLPCNDSVSSYSCARFSSFTNDIDPCSGKCQSLGGASNNSTCSGDTSPVNGGKGMKSTRWKEVPANCENLLECGLPNLDLSLGTEKRLAEQGAVPLYHEIMDSKNKEHQHSSAATSSVNDFSRSLDLSLALPVSMKEPVLNQGPEKKQLLPEWHYVDTSLSLFGGLGSL